MGQTTSNSRDPKYKESLRMQKNYQKPNIHMERLIKIKKDILLNALSENTDMNKKYHKYLLNLSVGIYFSQDWEKMKQFIKTIENTKFSSNLDFCFYNWENKEFKKLSFPLSLLNSLTYLRLSFVECSGFNQTGGLVISSLFKYMRLSELVVSIRFTKMNIRLEKGLIILCRNLRYLNCLKHFTLILSSNFKQISNNAIEVLFQSLRRMRLKTLKISNQLGRGENPDFDLLFEKLKELTYLSTLSLNLNFSDYCYSKFNINNLPKALTTLPFLQNLELKFNFEMSEKEIFFVKFSSEFKKLISLKQLKMELPFYFSHSESEMICEAFSSTFSHLKNLSELSLLFPQTHKITNETIRKLFLSFRALKSLKSLRLNFDLIQKYPNALLESLYEGVKELEFLSYLHLGISLQEKIELETFNSRLPKVKVHFSIVQPIVLYNPRDIREKR